MSSSLSPANLKHEELSLSEVVEEVAEFLPGQAPLRRFVHHNTLHHFEALPFEEAVVEAAKVFDCEPFPTEEFFRKELDRGRILESDLGYALDRDAASDEFLPLEGWTRGSFRRFRLTHLFEVPSSSGIRFSLYEGDLLEALPRDLDAETRARFLNGCSSESEALTRLWTSLLEAVPAAQTDLVAAHPEVTEEVHSLIIRFCSAYLDQGIGYWPMPVKSGLYETFVTLYSQPGVPISPRMQGLAKTLERQRDRGWGATEALDDALHRLGIAPEDRFEALRDRALALRGWAGMVRSMEKRPDLAPAEAPPAAFGDYLALYTILEAQALGAKGEAAVAPARRRRPNYERAFEAFRLAQLAGLGPSVLKDDASVGAWVREVLDFPDLERRRLLLWAYERRYRLEILDGIGKHARLGLAKKNLAPRFQAVFCIDDREESLRRHLEEIETRFETMGMAGFFGVTMTYQGWDDTRPLPLCPANQTPKHLVKEVPVDTVHRGGGRALGGVRQTYRASRNSVVRGGLLSMATGLLAGIPLVGRTLAPGLFHHMEHAFEHKVHPAPKTRLKMERGPDDKPNAQGLWEGFLPEEMAAVVRNAISTMGCQNLAPLFTIVGHGSSSLNNPHEAAHDCGATGGGRGGPNGRAFAAMANNPKVRKILADGGLDIPDSTWFVGAYHNTCDDSMEYYDTDLIPATLQGEFKAMKEALHQACVMDAHERCRRFHAVSLDASPKQAFQHVQARAVTLAQPRPEYGHCTNSIAVIGRRERTRGLFLDRRAFLVSYDPTGDTQGMVLGNVLESVGPVGAGINLEYYFSSVDNAGYGCGTKLPHNITGLFGVMDGHSSDLRTGLPWQMVEIHEPMRLLIVAESTPDKLMRILNARPGLKGLVARGWIQMVALDPDGPDLWTYENDVFVPHVMSAEPLRVVENSQDYYGGHREHLPPARVSASLPVAAGGKA